MATLHRSDAELRDLLKEQLQLLQSTMDSYDRGLAATMKQAAVCLRVLFHTTGTSTSLLQQTSLSSRLSWWDSAGDRDPRLVTTWSPLVGYAGSLQPGQRNASLHYVHADFLADQNPDSSDDIRFSGPAILDMGPADGPPTEAPPSTSGPDRWVTTDLWWSMPVFHTRGLTGIEPEVTYTRRGIVLALANREGGAHVDPTYKELEHHLMHGAPLAVEAVGGGRVAGNPVLPAVRQMAHEVMVTFRRAAPEYLT